MKFSLPKGKIVTIRKNGDDIMPNGAIMALDSEITISLQSHFDSLLSSGGFTKTLNVVSNVINSTTNKNISGSTKAMGYQIWSGTDPLSFSFSVTFDKKSSGKTDVLEPAKELMKLVLPTESKNSEGFGLQQPGPSITKAMGFDTTYAKYYSFRCGIFYLPSIIISKAEPTFSSTYDSDGYPIWCTVNMEVSSIFTATTNLIDGFSDQGTNAE